MSVAPGQPSRAARAGAADLLEYPRTAAYLEQLPEGLDSFPDCLAKTAIHRTIYSHTERTLTGLPLVLQAHLDHPPTVRWMPQCHTLALILVIVESRGFGPGSEGEWVRSAAALLFSTPMYKILMWAISTRLLIRGADIRWSAFFRGSSLLGVVGDREAELDLIAPPGLFDESLAVVFTDVLRSALSYSDYDADTAQLELVRFEPGRIRYHAHW